MEKSSEKGAMAVRNDTVAAIEKAQLLGLSMEKPFSRRLPVLETNVAGTMHVQGIRSRVKKLKKKDPVKLVRDVKNEYDELAVMVRNEQGQKLGFIPRAKNEVLARLMDAGKCFEAEVLWVRDRTEKQPGVYEAVTIWIRVYLVE